MGCRDPWGLVAGPDFGIRLVNQKALVEQSVDSCGGRCLATVVQSRSPQCGDQLQFAVYGVPVTHRPGFRFIDQCPQIRRHASSAPAPRVAVALSRPPASRWASESNQYATQSVSTSATFYSQLLGQNLKRDECHLVITLTDKPTMRSHAYSLLRTIMASAVNDELIDANPCRLVGAGRAKRTHCSWRRPRLTRRNTMTTTTRRESQSLFHYLV